VLAGLLAAAGLCACSGSDPQPSTLSPSPSPSTSNASPSPSATTPEQQIEAAVRTYYAELTKAAQTQDTSVLATLSTRGCPCFNVVRGIRDARSQGQTSPDASWTVSTVKVSQVKSRTASAEVEYTVSPYDVLKRDGSVQRHFDQQTGHVALSMVRGSDSGPWIIGNLFDLEA
jgi:hypothetical protein